MLSEKSVIKDNANRLFFTSVTINKSEDVSLNYKMNSAIFAGYYLNIFLAVIFLNNKNINFRKEKFICENCASLPFCLKRRVITQFYSN